MNKEVLFVTRYQEPDIVHHWDAAIRPLSEAQNYSGANQPTKEMVESDPMITGDPITESAAYDPIHFWKNRDPRFTSTIAYNGCLWELSGKKTESNGLTKAIPPSTTLPADSTAGKPSM